MPDDCGRCTGEYCDIHNVQGCDCDAIDRHNSNSPCPLLEYEARGTMPDATLDVTPDLVPAVRQRLRELLAKNDFVQLLAELSVGHLASLLDAADDRDRLRTENTRLREALERIVQQYDVGKSVGINAFAFALATVARNTLEGRTNG